jgi:hypothetical protein
MTLKKIWDHRLQGPNHTHPIVGHKGKGIRRTGCCDEDCKYAEKLKEAA